MYSIKNGTHLEKRIYFTTQPTLLTLPACVVYVLQMYNTAKNCFVSNNFTPSLFIVELPKLRTTHRAKNFICDVAFF